MRIPALACAMGKLYDGRRCSTRAVLAVASGKIAPAGFCWSLDCGQRKGVRVGARRIGAMVHTRFVARREVTEVA
jgi:hypothetical protein